MFFLIITLIATCVAQDLQWTNLKPMKTPRSDFTAVVVDEYSILTAGGCVSQACPADLPYCLCETVTDVLEIFYPGNNTWATLAPLPRQRFRHGAVIIKSKMYLVGGRNVSDDLITAVDVYDIASNTWSTAPELNWAQATFDYVLVNIGSVLYAIGGYDADYNAVSQTCTTSVLAGNWDCDSIPQLSHGRGDACGAVAGNEILIVGGFDDINFCSALDTLEVYHLTSNNWTVESRLDNPRADSACAVLHGRFHVIGGEVKDKLVDCNKYDIPVSHVEYYILSNNTWIEETPIPDPRFRFAGIAFRDGVMLMGGQGPLNATTGVQPILGTVSLLTDVSPSTDGVSSSASIMALSIALMTTSMFVL